MPYITQDRRDLLYMGKIVPADAGELNYVITRALTEYISHHGVRYSKMNDVVGALEGAKLEFYRRVVAPYENQKRAEHGDVYPEHYREIK
jgi:hypothetical protein